VLGNPSKPFPNGALHCSCPKLLTVDTQSPVIMLWSETELLTPMILSAGTVEAVGTRALRNWEVYSGRLLMTIKRSKSQSTKSRPQRMEHTRPGSLTAAQYHSRRGLPPLCMQRQGGIHCSPKMFGGGGGGS
jgi:hypothetical protein